jgi:hypothetical protein
MPGEEFRDVPGFACKVPEGTTNEPRRRAACVSRSQTRAFQVCYYLRSFLKRKQAANTRIPGWLGSPANRPSVRSFGGLGKMIHRFSFFFRLKQAFVGHGCPCSSRIGHMVRQRSPADNACCTNRCEFQMPAAPTRPCRAYSARNTVLAQLLLSTAQQARVTKLGDLNETAQGSGENVED